MNQRTQKNEIYNISLTIDDRNKTYININAKNSQNLNLICEKVCEKYNLDNNIKNKLGKEINRRIDEIMQSNNLVKSSNSDKIIERLYYDSIQRNKEKISYLETIKLERENRILEKYNFTPNINNKSNLLYKKNYFKIEDKLYNEYKIIKEKQNYERLITNISQKNNKTTRKKIESLDKKLKVSNDFKVNKKNNSIQNFKNIINNSVDQNIYQKNYDDKNHKILKKSQNTTNDIESQNIYKKVKIENFNELNYKKDNLEINLDQVSPISKKYKTSDIEECLEDSNLNINSFEKTQNPRIFKTKLGIRKTSPQDFVNILGLNSTFLKIKNYDLLAKTPNFIKNNLNSILHSQNKMTIKKRNTLGSDSKNDLISHFCKKFSLNINNNHRINSYTKRYKTITGKNISKLINTPKKNSKETPKSNPSERKNFEFNHDQENEINQNKKINIFSNVKSIDAFSSNCTFIPASAFHKLNHNRSKEEKNLKFDNLQNNIINVDLNNIPNKPLKKENDCLVQTNKHKLINSENEKNENFTLKNDESYNKNIGRIRNTNFEERNKINSNIETSRKQNSPTINSKSEITKKAFVISNKNNLLTLGQNNLLPTNKYSEKLMLNKLNLNPKLLQKKNFTSKEVPIIKMDDNCVNLHISKKIKSSNFDKKETHGNSFSPKIFSQKDKLCKPASLTNKNLEDKKTISNKKGGSKIQKLIGKKRDKYCFKELNTNEENIGGSSSDSLKNNTYLTITNINNSSNINITNINNNIFLRDTNLKSAGKVENKSSKNLSKSIDIKRKSNFLIFKKNKKKITSALKNLDMTKAKHKHLIKKERGEKDIFSYLYDIRNDSKKFKENFSNEIFSKIHTFTPKISNRSLSIQNMKRGKESKDDFIKRLSESKQINSSFNSKKIAFSLSKFTLKRQESIKTPLRQILKNDKFLSNSERLSVRKLASTNYIKNEKKKKILQTQKDNLDPIDNSREYINFNQNSDNSKNLKTLYFVKNKYKIFDNLTTSNTIITTERDNCVTNSDFSNQPLFNNKTPRNYKPNLINISEYNLEDNILNKNNDLESDSNLIYLDRLNIAYNSKSKMGYYLSKDYNESQNKFPNKKDFHYLGRNNETFKSLANRYNTIDHLNNITTHFQNNESYQTTKNLNFKTDNNCSESFKNKNYSKINNIIKQLENKISFNEGDSYIYSLTNTINSKKNLTNKKPNFLLTPNSYSMKTISKLKKNNRDTKKLKELKQVEELFSKFQELKTEKLKNKIFMENKFSKKIDNLQTNLLKEIYDLLEKNFGEIENLQGKGVSSNLIEYLITPVILILKKRNLELSFGNFHALAKEFIKNNMANAAI